MSLTNATGVKDVLEFIQTLLRDNLSDEITNLGMTNISAPVDSDIQIGPTYAFGGDPVIGIDWVQSFILGQLGPREEVRVRCRIQWAFNVSASTDTAASIVTEADRALWYTIHRHYRQTSPTIIYAQRTESRPFNREQPIGGIQGDGVDMLVDVNCWFILPPLP